jgi:hypothetical protein
MSDNNFNIIPAAGVSFPLPPVSKTTRSFVEMVGAIWFAIWWWKKVDEVWEHPRREHIYGIDPNLPQAQRDALRKQADADYKALVRQRKAEYKAGRRWA